MPQTQTYKIIKDDTAVIGKPYRVLYASCLVPLSDHKTKAEAKATVRRYVKSDERRIHQIRPR